MQYTFNQDDFLNATIDTGGERIDDRPLFVPNCECQGQIVNILGRAFQDKNTQLYRMTADVIWEVMDRGILDRMEVSEARVKQTLWIRPEREDWTPGQGFSFSLKKGQNSDTGQLLTALGMNPPPRDFKFPMLMHSTAWLLIKEPAPDDDRATMSSVVRVAKSQVELSPRGKSK